MPLQSQGQKRPVDDVGKLDLRVSSRQGPSHQHTPKHHPE